MRHSPGFALIEMLIVVTIISILAAVAIPNLLNAIDRTHQSSTISDMRVIATALENYAVENHGYPVADELADLREDLQPKYVKKLPLEDGWDHPLAYEAEDDGSTYTLSSPGKDGEFQSAQLPEKASEFDADIVCVDGVFLEGSETEDGK